MALHSILVFEIEHTIENNWMLTYRKKQSGQSCTYKSLTS